MHAELKFFGGDYLFISLGEIIFLSPLWYRKIVNPSPISPTEIGERARETTAINYFLWEPLYHRGHNLRLEIQLAKSSIRYNVFANRVKMEFFTTECSQRDSNNSFKKKLALIDLSIF